MDFVLPSPYFFSVEKFDSTLYDTYYWIRFRNNPFPILKFIRKDLLESIVLFESNTTSFIYPRDMAKDIQSFCDELLLQYSSKK